MERFCSVGLRAPSCKTKSKKCSFILTFFHKKGKVYSNCSHVTVVVR